jgi:Leucine-rich repeat (LRR) protein
MELSDELIIHILQFIGNDVELNKFITVCKKWNEIIPQCVLYSGYSGSIINTRYTNSLKNLTNLTHLDICMEIEINSNNIDISPLENLKKITTIKLDSLKISDISPLTNLNNLTYLFLHRSSISDITRFSITPLSNLTNLKELFLGHNFISDITPLSNLTNLITE